jgi:hypothetical protein
MGNTSLACEVVRRIHAIPRACDTKDGSSTIHVAAPMGIGSCIANSKPLSSTTPILGVWQVCHNRVSGETVIQSLLDDPDCADILTTDADKRGLTPLFWEHVLPYGEVKLNVISRLTLSGAADDGRRSSSPPAWPAIVTLRSQVHITTLRRRSGGCRACILLNLFWLLSITLPYFYLLPPYC